VTKSNHQPMEMIEAESSVGDFDNLRLNSNVIEQQLPILPKTPETNELVSDYTNINFRFLESNCNTQKKTPDSIYKSLVEISFFENYKN